MNKPPLIKLCDGVARSCAILEDAYGDTLVKLHRLVTAARCDFTLDDKDIHVVVFNDERYNHMLGITFTMPENAVMPADYQIVRSLPFEY